MARAKRRTQAAPSEQAVVDPREKRWERNQLAVADLPGLGRRFWNVTSTPLDAYRCAKGITARQYDAGDRLRALWTQAGQEPRVTSSYERLHGGPREMSDEAADAWDRFWRTLQPLDQLYASVVRDVCCFAVPVEFATHSNGVPAHAGLLILRHALEGLARR